MVLILNPMMVFANIIGSIMNKILPEGIIMIILIVVILGGIIVNIRNARIKYKEETRMIMKKYSTVDEDLEENLTEKSESHHSDESIPKSNSQEEIRHSTSLTSTQKLSELEELEYLKKYEGKNYHPIKTTLFILTIVITVIYSLLQGTSSIKSLIDLERCSWEQIPLFFVVLIAIIIINLYSIKVVKREQYLKIKYNWQFKHEVNFTNKKIVFLSLFGLIVGMLANLLGLGGGFVIFPMLVMIGVSPLVASATTIYMIFISKFVAAFLAMFSQFIIVDYTLTSVCLVCISIIVFSKLSDYILKK